jgi:hypothetical protein
MDRPRFLEDRLDGTLHDPAQKVRVVEQNRLCQLGPLTTLARGHRLPPCESAFDPPRSWRTVASSVTRPPNVQNSRDTTSTGRFLLFVRAGDSYSDLILHDLETGTEQPLTHDQANASPGGADYVAGSA